MLDPEIFFSYSPVNIPYYELIISRIKIFPKSSFVFEYLINFIMVLNKCRIYGHYLLKFKNDI